MNDQSRTITKSAFSFLSGTMLSRISGLARDLAMAFFFGTSASIAAFFIALRLAVLIRRLFGEGALLNGFIPHFESIREVDSKKAALFFRDVFFSTALFLLAITGIGEIGLYYWIESSSIISLIMLILPGVFFVCLFGLSSALLHCEKYFFLTGISPVAYNAIWILGIWLFRNEPPSVAAVGLSIAISCAFFFQWLMTIPKMISYIFKELSLKEWIKPKLFSLEIRKMFTSLSLGVLGVAGVQINTAVDTIFARIASLEGPAYLNYAIHMQQLPLALFGVAISSALLPPLSRAFQREDNELSKTLLTSAVSNSLLFILPCTAAIFALGRVSVNLLFGRGDFTATSAFHTTDCLLGYGFGLIPMVFALLFAPAFYAKKDYWTPTKISLLSIGLNLFLNYLFVLIFHLGPASLAYSTSIAAFVNAFYLYRMLPIKIEAFRSAIKIVGSCFISLVVTNLFDRVFFLEPFPKFFSEQLLQFFTLFTIFFGFFILLMRKEFLMKFGRKL